MLGLSLPVDIPWKKLAASEDMMVRAPASGGAWPRRWRSSIAIFGHQPGDDYQTYDGMTVSYLKVVATVTGFQPDSDEVGIKDRRAYQAWSDPQVIEEYEKAVTAYYGCYGAILEVVVTPKGTREELRTLPFDQYPYFADFEPKKRELYELVSETGEVMSRSLEMVNVRKGATTSESHERVDSIGTVLSLEATVPVGKVPVTGTAGLQTQSTSRNVSNEEVSNVRTSESDREARESYSHTTQLTQMYHQLNSYHLGTNRIVFYMLPRPHIVETPKTFVNGPRMIEGMQEYFLVVVRPKEIAEICVDAYLETAHIAPNPRLDHERSIGTVELHLFQPAPPRGRPLVDDDEAITRSGAETYTPPDGWEIDIVADGDSRRPSAAQPHPSTRPGGGTQDDGTSVEVPPLGYRIEAYSSSGRASYHVEPSPAAVTVSGTVTAVFDDRVFGNTSTDGRLDLVVSAFIRRRQPTVIGYDQTLYLTGRSLSTCPLKERSAPATYVSWEGELDNPSGKRIGQEPMTIHEANRIRAQIGKQIFDSIDHPGRYPAGKVRFVESQIVAGIVSRMMGSGAHQDNMAVVKLKGLDRGIARKLEQSAPEISRRRLLQMAVPEQMVRLGLTVGEAAELRRFLLGLDSRTGFMAPVTRESRDGGVSRQSRKAKSK